MKDIKFRAWTGEEMLVGKAVRWPWAEDAAELNDGIEAMTTELHYVLMQYTGLKDRNGTEIYEGDRVIVASRQTQRGTVIWYNGCLYVQGDDGWVQDFMRESFGDGSEFEVIGNIYENPELTQ